MINGKEYTSDHYSISLKSNNILWDSFQSDLNINNHLIVFIIKSDLVIWNFRIGEFECSLK